MTFSFLADLSTAVSRVRQYLGDTVSTGHLVEDETITAYLASRSELAAAAQLASDLAARYAQEINSSADGANQAAASKFDHYRSLAETLRTQAAAEVQPTADSGFAGIGVYGATAQEVYAARDDCTAARNARPRFG